MPRCMPLRVALVIAGCSAQNLTSWPTPFSELGCATVQAADGAWLWGSPLGARWPSCDLPIRGDGATVCIDPEGRVDQTSIFVNMRSTIAKTGCFAWTISECNFDLRRVSKVEFDIDLANCGDVWMAPLWLSPNPWIGPGGLSGEIDLVEGCSVGQVRTNFAGCAGASGAQCHQDAWGSAAGLGGPKHVIMTLSAGLGDLLITVCNWDYSYCFPSSSFSNFYNTVHSTAGRGASFPYTIISDVWNGYSGDGGWYGCNARNNPNTQCEYAIRNIQFTSHDGAPIFGGKCGALNKRSAERVVV